MSDSKIRIKNIGTDSAQMRLIKLNNKSKVTPEPLGVGEVSSFKTSDEDIRVCLAAPLQSTVIAQLAQESTLAELIGNGKISEPYLDAEEIAISHNETLSETSLAVKFSSRIKDNILSNVTRKQHYLLDLGVSDISTNDVVIRATKYNSTNGEAIGTVNQTLPRTKLLKTSAGNIIYPLEISEVDSNYYIDLTVDFDGQRNRYLPTFHRVNVSVTVEASTEASMVVVRGFDAALIDELKTASITYKKEANSFSILDTTTSIKTLISKQCSALFQYKLDTSIVLQQSFVLEFLAHLIDDASVVDMSINGEVISKAELISKSIKVNDKYYYLLTISNQARKDTVVDINVDYDGGYRDYIQTNYRFTFVSNITTPPPIPMFALSAMRARIEIKDENTYYYEGFRFLQFKLPIPAACLVKIEIVASATNYSIKPISSKGTIMPVETKEELKALALFNSNHITTYEEGKQEYWGFKEAGEVIFQVKLPMGLTGMVYFGMLPIETNTNLLTYNKATMQVTGIENTIPPLTIRDDSSISLYRTETNTSDNSKYSGVAIFDKLLMPGMAIAFTGLTGNDTWSLRFIDESTKMVEIPAYNTVYVNRIRNQDTKADSFNLNHYFFTAHSSIPANTREWDLENVLGSRLSSYTYTIFRTRDNKLMIFRYTVIGNMAVEVYKQAVLVNDLSVHGYTPEKGMKLAYTRNSAPTSVAIEITEPYEVTMEELTTFEPEQKFVATASIKLMEVYGRNNLPT